MTSERTVATQYETDIVAWANEQARLLRAGQFDLLDLEHIADEIEDVGKSEQRELANRMAVLLAHLLKWQYQPARQCINGSQMIQIQRRRVMLRLKKTPSLASCLVDPEWWADTWADALIQAINETGLSDFPEHCPWATDSEILNPDWLP